MAFILVIWFVISFVTNIIGPLMPIIIETYGLTLTTASFLPFSFFLAYGVMSIPAGAMIESIGEKRSMLIAFALNFVGSMAFALYPSYIIALISLFIIGIGMAMLQVIINPLMRTAGGEENFAFFSVLGQLVFGLASFISPFVFSYLVNSAHGVGNKAIAEFLQETDLNSNWILFYWIFSFTFLSILIIISIIRFPKVELKEDEKTGSFNTYKSLINRTDVKLFFLGIVAYVGTEQGLSNWMSEFLKQYHGIDPSTTGAKAVAWFWGSMSIGCLAGLACLKLWDSKIVLRVATILSMITLAFALFGTSALSSYAFPVMGFFISLMFSIIFSLALNSVSEHHGSFSGILCTGIFGGALFPMLIGILGDVIGLRFSMTIIFISLLYIIFIAFYAKPLINNKTISIKPQSRLNEK